VVNTLAKLAINCWCVSTTMAKEGKLRRAARETKGFPTETEAKQFAKAMLSDGHTVTAGTVYPHEPIRRTVSAREVYRWVEEEGWLV
jgi:hypothetical protein